MEEKKSLTNPTTSLGSTGYKRTLGGSTAADSGTSSGLGGRKDSNTGYLKTSSLLNTTKPSTKPPRAAEQPPSYGAFGLSKKLDEKDSYGGTAN